MTEFASGQQKSHGRKAEFDKRDVRALNECMSVLPEGGNVFSVVGENGNTYGVDAQESRCTCPDHQHREVTCKHLRRVRFATGRQAIPAYVDPEGVDPLLGENVEGGPVVAASDGGIIVADDDGEMIDSGDGRPDNCECDSLGDDLPCWPCYREGFETPATNR